MSTVQVLYKNSPVPEGTLLSWTVKSIERKNLEFDKTINLKAGFLYGGIPLYGPENVKPPSFDTSELRGEFSIGSFVFLASNFHVLLIKKRRAGFWYIPGGLAEPHDHTLQRTAARELAEETGLNLKTKFQNQDGLHIYVPQQANPEEEADVSNIPQNPRYFYESLIYRNDKPVRHNLMAVYTIIFDHLHRIDTTPIDTEEISDVRWVNVAEFLTAMDEGRVNTKQSIILAFEKYLETLKHRADVQPDEWDYTSHELADIRPNVSPLVRSLCLAYMLGSRSANESMYDFVQKTARFMDESINNINW